ncbi:unnamed protein product [Schistosoma spindalis]|nr:unnamed protein product [Schistosoma spindale]
MDFSSSVKVQKVLTVNKLPAVYRTVPTAHQMASWPHLKDISFPRVEDENVKLLIGCNAPGIHEMKEIRTGKTNEPSAVRTILGWTLFGSYREPRASNCVPNYLSAKEELEDKFEQLHSTEFKDPFSRTSSISVEDRIASPESYKPLASQTHCSTDASESACGVAEYARSENVSRQVHCSFLLSKYKVFKPKSEALCANKPESTLGKPKEETDTKLKVKTTKRPKATVTKKPVTKTLKKHTAHIRRGIEDGVEKGALVRVVNKTKGSSGSFTGTNTILRQIKCSCNQNKIANVLFERGCGVREHIIRSIKRIPRVPLFQNVLIDGALQTFLTEAGRILNNRPLVKMTDDPVILEALTWNKLLIYKGLSFDGASVDKTLLYNKRWKEAQRLATAFWNRRMREYLPTLQTRDKWLNVHKNLQPGGPVLVSSVETSRGLWPKAIVEQVSYGSDGRVRTAKLRTANEEIVRDVRSLYLLEKAGYLWRRRPRTMDVVRVSGGV